jgi:hypothetical protein
MGQKGPNIAYAEWLLGCPADKCSAGCKLHLLKVDISGPIPAVGEQRLHAF